MARNAESPPDAGEKIGEHDGGQGDLAGRMKELEAENERLRHVAAEQALDIRILREVARGDF